MRDGHGGMPISRYSLCGAGATVAALCLLRPRSLRAWRGREQAVRHRVGGQIAVFGNLLDDIAALEYVVFVMHDGRIVGREGVLGRQAAVWVSLPLRTRSERAMPVWLV